MHIWTEKTVDRDSQQKLYVQMYSIIKEKVEKREWPNGTQIPTEDNLCKTFAVSKATVRMAVSALVRDGYLRKLQGKGTFVINTLQDLGITMKTKLTEDMFGEGVRAKKEVLMKGVRQPCEETIKLLQRDESDESSHIYYILCKRIVDGETACLEEAFMPLAVFPDIENEDVCRKPFYDLIQERGVKKISKIVQTIEVSEIQGDAASILKAKDGSPALLLHRLLIGSDMRPIAYTKLLGIGKKYKIQTELERIK